RALLRLREEATEVEFEIWQCAESIEENLLSAGSVGITRPGAHAGGKIPDGLDRIIAVQQPPRQLDKIEPFVRATLERPIVEIEAIYVHVDLHATPKTTRAAEAFASCGP